MACKTFSPHTPLTGPAWGRPNCVFQMTVLSLHSTIWISCTSVQCTHTQSDFGKWRLTCHTPNPFKAPSESAASQHTHSLSPSLTHTVKWRLTCNTLQKNPHHSFPFHIAEVQEVFKFKLLHAHSQVERCAILIGGMSTSKTTTHAVTLMTVTVSGTFG